MKNINLWLRADHYYFPTLRLQPQFKNCETDAEGEGQKNNKKRAKRNMVELWKV